MSGGTEVRLRPDFASVLALIVMGLDPPGTTACVGEAGTGGAARGSVNLVLVGARGTAAAEWVGALIARRPPKYMLPRLEKWRLSRSASSRKLPTGMSVLMVGGGACEVALSKEAVDDENNRGPGAGLEAEAGPGTGRLEVGDWLSL